MLLFLYLCCALDSAVLPASSRSSLQHCRLRYRTSGSQPQPLPATHTGLPEASMGPPAWGRRQGGSAPFRAQTVMAPVPAHAHLHAAIQAHIPATAEAEEPAQLCEAVPQGLHMNCGSSVSSVAASLQSDGHLGQRLWRNLGLHKSVSSGRCSPVLYVDIAGKSALVSV